MKRISLAIIAALATCTLSAQTLEFKVKYDAPQQLNKDVFGVNNEFTHANYTPNSNVYKELFVSSGAQSCRYPAGTSSNYINIATGQAQIWDNANEGSIKRYHDIDATIKRVQGENGVDYRDFIKFVKEVNPTVTYIMNVTTMTKEENRSVMQGFKDAGVELTCVEMGNEVFFGTYSSAFANVDEYLARTKEYAAMVREVFPKCKIALVTLAEYYTKEVFLESEPEKGNRLEEWYRGLMKCDFHDALSIHIYSDIGMDGKTKKADFLPYSESYLSVMSHSDQRAAMTLNRIKKDFPGKEAWITEYHVGGFSGEIRSYRLRYSYLGGLFCANFMLKLFQHPNVTLSSWHAMGQWMSVPRNVDPDTIENIEYYNNYYAFKMFKDPVLNSNSYVPVTITNSNKYKGRGEYKGNYNDAEAGMFYNDETKRGYLVLFNKFDSKYSLNAKSLSKSLDGKIISCKEYAPGKGKNLENALYANTGCRTGNVKAKGGVYQVSPYSITVIEFER